MLKFFSRIKYSEKYEILLLALARYQNDKYKKEGKYVK